MSRVEPFYSPLKNEKMKTFKLISIAILLSSLFFSCGDKETENPFMNEIIRKYGKNGTACFDKDGNTYCIAKASNPKMAITVGTKMKPDAKLVICLQKSGELNDCEEVQASHCHPDNQCFCKGLEDCAKLAAKCPNGGCGDCSEGDCCCVKSSNGTPNKFLAKTEEEFKQLIANPNAKMIRSVADFEKMCKSNTAPFSKLDEGAIEEFKKYIVFKDNGLSWARYDMIENKLSSREFIIFWEAFGLSEEFTLDHKGYKCVGTGTCDVSTTAICTSNC